MARILWEQLVLPRHARRRELDLLHAPVYVGPLDAPCPLVVSVHDLSFFRFPDLFPRIKRYYLQPFTRMTVRRASVVLASSESTGRDLVDILGASPDKIRVIPLGVDEGMRPLSGSKAVKVFRRRESLPEHMILYVGTLEPRKNLSTLLEAYARLCREPGFKHDLVIAGGKGWYYEEIDRTVERLGLRGRVLFPGFVPDADLPLWYNAADLFVYPSLYEGFGLPPLEAMACGTPVVVSDVSSLPEVVGGAGLAVAPSDSEALARAMARLLGDGELRDACRASGLERAQQFSWGACARKTADVYHQVLENTG